MPDDPWVAYSGNGLPDSLMILTFNFGMGAKVIMDDGQMNEL
jgi:hypothetical protein